MTDELEQLVGRTMDRAGHADRDVVRQTVEATLRTLGSQLGGVPPALHDVIPEGLHREITAGVGVEALRPAELYEQMSTRLGVRPGVALELVQSALAELGERTGRPGRELLRDLLPPAWAILVTNPRPRSRAVPAATPIEGGHTLATGRPGGTRPLANAAPLAGQADSIAVSDDPHGDRLATAHGPGPHDDGSTLAAGRSGSHRSVAGSD